MAANLWSKSRCVTFRFSTSIGRATEQQTIQVTGESVSAVVWISIVQCSVSVCGIGFLSSFRVWVARERGRKLVLSFLVIITGAFPSS